MPENNWFSVLILVGAPGRVPPSQAGPYDVHLEYADLVHAPAVLGPLLWQVESSIAQGVALVRDVAEEDADLAVLDLAEPPAPLALYSDGLLALPGEGGGVEDKDGVGLAQVGTDLALQVGIEPPT